MAAIGIVYLVFEDYIIEQLPKTKKEEVAAGKPIVSRTVFGIQIGLVVLSMIVTRLSIDSIVSRQGLPIGTQIVGWLTLSMLIDFHHIAIY
jgi:phosphatidylinositol glycan class N